MPFILGIASGSFVVVTAIAWNKAFPHISVKSFIAAIVLVLGFFTNVVFVFAALATRQSKPVATSWKVVVIASLVNNVAVLGFFPVFARNIGYWLWLLAFVIVTWALLFLKADRPEPAAPVPAILWVWIGCLSFWLLVMVVNYVSPSHGAAGAPKTQPLALTSYVSDFANLLKPEERAWMSQMLRGFDERTSDQIAVAIYPRCPGPSIEDFTIQAAAASKFGRIGLDNGAVLFLFVAERTARIEVGYGLEAALPDAKARRILDEQLAPHFARGEYGEGTAATLSAMCEAVEGEYGATHKKNVLALLWPQLKTAVSKTVRRAWPLARDAPLGARIGISFFGGLLGIGVWDGAVNGGRIVWDIFVGIGNLIRRRRFRTGMKPFTLDSLYDTVKLMVILAVIAGGYVLIAGGGSFGGGGALIRWIAMAP